MISDSEMNTFKTIVAEVEPVGRLLFRDARPFQAGDGHIARNVAFPPPPNAFCPAVARVFRRAYSGTSQVSCTGPFIGRDGQETLYPVPLDLQSEEFEDADGQRAYLRPQRKSPLATSSYGGPYRPLTAAGKVQMPKGAFVSGGELASYLKSEDGALQTASVAEIYEAEMRTGNELSGRNVKIGRLYSEQVLHLKPGIRFRVGIRYQGEIEQAPGPSGHVIRLGGEARLAHCVFRNDEWDRDLEWDRKSKQELRKTLRDGILKAGAGEPLRVKLVLLTPAIVSANMELLHKNPRWKTEAWVPPWLSSRKTGQNPFGARLVSAICGKPFPIGMWDGIKRDPKGPDGVQSKKANPGPRPLYRMLPAGAVFFLELDVASADRAAIVDKCFDLFWFGSILRRQDLNLTYFGRMGLGTAIIGGWNYEHRSGNGH